MNRRRFLQLTGLAGTSLYASRLNLPAIVPIVRKGDPRLRLSVAAYSFRRQFAFMKGSAQRPTGKGIDMPGFIDFCADHGADAAELTSYFFPAGHHDKYYLGLKRHAHLRGIAISGTAVGNNFALPAGEARDQQIADLKAWIDRASLMSAPHVRVFSGAAKKGMEVKEAQKLCIAALEECCEYAGKKGIFLGLENHGGLVAEADPMLEIVKAVDSPWFGVSLDTGNFRTADPYGDLAKLAPYAVNVQLKVDIQKAGEKEKQPADLARLVKILRDAGYQGYVALEYEEEADPYVEVPKYIEKLREAMAS